MKRDSWVFLIVTACLAGGTLVGLANDVRWRPWGEKPLRVSFETSSARQLSTGMEVRLLGVSAGRLTAINITDEARVKGELIIDPSFRRFIGPQSSLSVDQDGIIGDSYIALTPDKFQLKKEKKGSGSINLKMKPALDVRRLLIELAETRIKLNSVLDTAGVVLKNDLPGSLRSFDNSMISIKKLSDLLKEEAKSTAPSIRATLQKADASLIQIMETGSSAKLTSEEIKKLIMTLNSLVR